MATPRRAQPTVRVMRDDLGIAIEDTELDAHSPLSGCDHPIVRKAAASFSVDPSQDVHEGPIKSSPAIRLFEIKQSQWRGGVWVDDETGQPWLVVAGLAKGGHQDHDDFYKRIARTAQGGGLKAWLPTEVDHQQHRREQAAALILRWELRLQESAVVALESVSSGGEAQIRIPHPKDGEPDIGSATVTVELIREPDYEHDDCLLEVHLEPQHKSSALGWEAITRLLATISPVQTGWDIAAGICAPTLEPFNLVARLGELRTMIDERQLVAWSPKDASHYSHHRNLADASVNGKATRAMCGVFFVPTRDPEALPVCENCRKKYEALP